MAGKAEYKNAVRSKQLIRQAFFDLLQKKPAGKITVTDIVTTANINRGTFYAHYADIQALIETIETEFIEQLYAAISELKHIDLVNSPLNVLLRISDFIEQDVELYKKLVQSGVFTPFLSDLQEKLVEYLENTPATDSSIRSSMAFQARARFFASGAVSLYIAWLKGEIGGTLQQLAFTLNDIIVSDSLFFQASTK